MNWRREKSTQNHGHSCSIFLCLLRYAICILQSDGILSRLGLLGSDRSSCWMHLLPVSLSILGALLVLPEHGRESPFMIFPLGRLYFRSSCWSGYRDHPLKNSALISQPSLNPYYVLFTTTWHYIAGLFPPFIHTPPSGWHCVLLSPKF